MKLRCPAGCGGVSHAGFSVDIDSDGCVDVGKPEAAALLVHGFTLLPDTDSHDEMWPESESSGPDDIDRLNRRGLFAFLKSKGVSVALPVTNDALRALARHALGDTDPSSNDTKGS